MGSPRDAHGMDAHELFKTHSRATITILIRDNMYERTSYDQYQESRIHRLVQHILGGPIGNGLQSTEKGRVFQHRPEKQTPT